MTNYDVEIMEVDGNYFLSEGNATSENEFKTYECALDAMEGDKKIYLESEDMADYNENSDIIWN